MSIVENALTDIRLEWVEESTVGEPPSDPSWNKFSDYIDNFTGTPGLSVSENEAVGSGDTVRNIRGAETDNSLTVEYWLQRFPTSGGSVVDPIAEPFLHDYNDEYPSHTVVYRRISNTGGADGAGFRQYSVAFGALPTSATIPGDPGEDSPQSLELGYDSAERYRTYVIDQPSAGTTLTVESTDSAADDGNVTVTVEDEGAATSEQIDVGATGTETFSDIDAIYVSSGEPQGDISITDGSGTTFLTLDGINTDGIDYDRGIPPLGTGSHASDIGNNPERYLFLNTNSIFNSGEIAERIHQFDLTCEVDTSVEPQQGTRRPTIDPGTRTVEADVDIAEDTGSTNRIREFLRGTTGDIVYTLGGTAQGSGAGDITITDAQIVEVDDQSYGAGDANNIYNVTFRAADEDNDGTVATMSETA
jgi:hypothetical protein